MAFQDLFSGHAQDYAKFRPRYPSSLFEHLKALCASRECAWDCATGNGQAAVELSRFFTRVVATDASLKQIAIAEHGDNIDYRVAPAEKSELPDQSVDLITVAQAFHWFNHEEFFREVRRVSKPEGKLAIWSYNLCETDPSVDSLTKGLYHDVLGSYWAFERSFVEQEYRTIRFPFPELPARRFEMSVNWTLEQFLGYLGTWSSLKTYIQKNGTNPLEALFGEFSKAWGPEKSREIRWPFSLRVFGPLHG